MLDDAHASKDEEQPVISQSEAAFMFERLEHRPEVNTYNTTCVQQPCT